MTFARGLICKTACAIVRAGGFIDHEISTGKPYYQKINGYIAHETHASSINQID